MDRPYISTGFYTDPETNAALDRLTAAYNRSRSFVVRALINTAANNPDFQRAALFPQPPAQPTTTQPAA